MDAYGMLCIFRAKRELSTLLVACNLHQWQFWASHPHPTPVLALACPALPCPVLPTVLLCVQLGDSAFQAAGCTGPLCLQRQHR